ncbi:MAG TPA: hypothetical protein VJO16_02735 [Candidatus Acidoferrum sp.]|nr:hypothetical protein [Candidatus Acidoferrum sp.]
MTNRFRRQNGYRLRKVRTFALLLAFSPIVARSANGINGSVRNLSRGEPAAGDEVILVRLDTEMHEEARVRTDGQGVFALNVHHPDKPYLVRVLHQGVNYDQQVSVGDVVSMKVFDTAPKVRGVTGSIEVLRIGTIGNLLHVSDLIQLKNESNPPLTQAGARTFEVYLPANARIDSVLAAGPGEAGATIAATPVAGEPGHYVLKFPLRPGATKLAFNYDLPYHGHAMFHPRRALPVQQLAVMIPLTMKFSSQSSSFEPFASANSRYQVQAAGQLGTGNGPEFELSGTGALPPLGDQTDSQSASPSAVAPKRERSIPDRAALPSLASVHLQSEQTQSPSQSRVLVGLTSILIAACVFLVWRGRKFQKPLRRTKDCATGQRSAA